MAWKATKVRSRSTTLLLACGLAAALGLLALVLHWQGGDWPAQLYRINLFKRVGFNEWDNNWYGGHHTPAYSLLFPPLGGLLGPWVVGIASAVLATWCFTQLALTHFEHDAARAASILFAAGTVTNLAVGRLTFALGMALGLAAALALAERRHALAAVLAVLTPLASPVAAVFLAIAAGGWFFTRRRRWIGLMVGVLALVPIGVLAVAYPEGGRFPFRAADAALTIGIALVGAAIAPPDRASIRIAALAYAAVATVAFFVPNPLGGNVTRMATYLTGPLLAGLFWGVRRWLVVVLAVPLLVWQWQPAYDAIFNAGRDPSAKAPYYEPLLAFLSDKQPARIEIPFTQHHWETDYVAPTVALARGWERQLDIGLNPIFYQPTLSADAYRNWLVANAVAYVALPDAPLDPSSRAEASLLARGVPGLRPAWHNAHWRVWQVVGARSLVDGPGFLAAMGSESFTVRAWEAGQFLVRIRYSSHWEIQQGPGACISTSPDGWTSLSVSVAGDVHVVQGVIPALGTRCTAAAPATG